ncbi:response regulator [Halarcobacter sp.]|uniref:response regulator n=1 Tax=Halarcobacter sp. TaxID=2321133 RepID=UPI003A91B599
MPSVDKNLLKRLTILYVEDDESVRNELVSLLSNFFQNVFSAKDGKEGLELYEQRKDDIDVIIADINMPNLSGIEMVKKIRETDKDISILFATAYSDNEFLSEAIKLKVFEYITKPIDIRKLMTVLNELALMKYQDFLIAQQTKELKKYKDIMYNNNIVIRTDSDFKIKHVNELFCEITGFDKDELVGKDIDTIRHPETDKKIYEKIKKVVPVDKKFEDRIKNLKKDGTYYISNTSVVAVLNDAGEFIGSLMIQKDETQEAIKRREVQSHLIKDKGEIFIKGKEASAELQHEINKLIYEIENLKKEVKAAKADKDQYIYTVEKYRVENKKLKQEYKRLRNEADSIEEKHSLVKKVNKENADMKIENKMLHTKLEDIESEHEKECKQIKVNFEIEIDDLEEELSALREKVENVENAEAVSQKLSYWKEKAKAEAKKVDRLEKELLNIAPKDVLVRIFGSS